MTQDEKDAAFYRQWAAEYDAKNAAKQRPEFDLSDDPYAPSGAAEEAAQQPKPAPVGNVVSMAAAVAARKPKPEPSVTKPYHVVLAGMVIDTVKARKGQDFMFVGKTAYRCLDSLWTMETDGLAGWLNVEIERAAQYMKQPSNNKLIAEARGWIQRQEKLNRNPGDVKWDAHGMIPTRSGLVSPRTGECRPMRPDDYCTWRIETEYDPKATCPWWLQMLEDVFADKSKEERAGTIAMIQELLGAGLIDVKPRELSKALIFQGGSNFGKSGLLEVMSGLFGCDVNSTSIEELEGPHGTMPFIKRKPWVLHEAFDQRKWHFSSSVKAIVTGEPISVNIKNGPMLSLRVRAPIFWATNHPPQFKESTKAVTNRLVVIKCTREFFEDHPVGAAEEARRLGLGKPSNLVLEREMPGLLAWALQGLQRALERGRLLPTKAMTDASEEIRRDSNLVAGFLEECCWYDSDRRISVPDFCLAFAAWFLQNKGENRSVPSNETIGKALLATSDSKIAMGEDLRDGKRRYHAGIVLNEEGLAFHQSGYENRDLQGKTANATEPRGTINSVMPPQWLEKQSIKAMRKACDGLM